MPVWKLRVQLLNGWPGVNPVKRTQREHWAGQRTRRKIKGSVISSAAAGGGATTQRRGKSPRSQNANSGGVENHHDDWLNRCRDEKMAAAAGSKETCMSVGVNIVNVGTR